MGEPTFTQQQIQEAIWAVLGEHPVTLWLGVPQDTTTPSGHLHPEDAGHVARWVLERLQTVDAQAGRAMSNTANPFESLTDAIAFSSADWGQTRDMAWVYGIVLGWDADPGEEDDGAMDELAQRFGWDAETVARLRRLHREFQREARAYKAVVFGE